MKNYTVTETHAGRRLDKVLKVFFPDMPMAGIFKNLRTGKIKLNKKKAKPEDKLELGDELTFFLTEKDVAQTVPKDPNEEIKKLKETSFFKNNFSILFEDADLLILNKPAGIAVHPGSGHRHGRTMTDLAQSYTLGKTRDFETTLIHRLDLDTSGVLVFAKNAKALRFMNKQMQEHETTEKIYTALCRGVIERDKGTIRVALERTEGKSKSTKVIISKGGKDAKMSVTHYQVLQRFADATLIQVKLDTGRMHQIRVHMKSQGHALWGDEHYGDFAFNKEIAKEPFRLKRMFLHATSLSFLHPSTQKIMTVKAPLPAELQHVIQVLKKTYTPS